VKGCADCEESRVLCQECRGPVCPSHRIGTGALSEGYHCSMGCSLMAVGFIPRPKESVLKTYWSLFVLGVFIAVWAIIQHALSRM
jgi:hypothetical protein